MSKELMYILIAKMHVRLNTIIVANNYDLLDAKVQRYSRRLDKVLMRYNRLLESGKNYKCKLSPYENEAMCLTKQEA